MGYFPQDPVWTLDRLGPWGCSVWSSRSIYQMIRRLASGVGMNCSSGDLIWWLGGRFFPVLALARCSAAWWLLPVSCRLTGRGACTSCLPIPRPPIMTAGLAQTTTAELWECGEVRQWPGGPSQNDHPSPSCTSPE